MSNVIAQTLIFLAEENISPKNIINLCKYAMKLEYRPTQEDYNLLKARNEELKRQLRVFTSESKSNAAVKIGGSV